MRITKIFEVLFELSAVLAVVAVLCYGATWHIGTFVACMVLAWVTRREYKRERRSR
jgi:hypothetical protein